MKKTVMNVQTGKAEEVDMTPEEMADVEARWAEASANALIVKSVTMRQARLALLVAGKLAAVEAAVGSAGQAAQIEWEYATEVRRDWR